MGITSEEAFERSHRRVIGPEILLLKEEVKSAIERHDPKRAALGAEFPWASCLPGEILAREALLHLAYPVERFADVSND